MIIAIAGHRPDKLGGWNIPNDVSEVVIQELDKKLMKMNPSKVYTGMALGVDQWAAELCVMNDIPFVAAIPFLGFDGKWPPHARQRFQDLCKLAEKVHVVSNTVVYNPKLMHARNEWMVRNSDAVLAVWNGSSGGTANCVNFAHSIGRKVCLVTLPSPTWSKAKEVEEELEFKRLAAQGKWQAYKAGLSQTSEVAQAAKAAVSVDHLYGTVSPAKPVEILKKAVTEEVRRVDHSKPKRAIELD